MNATSFFRHDKMNLEILNNFILSERNEKIFTWKKYSPSSLNKIN